MSSDERGKAAVMETYEVLEKALALIEDEENWCGSGWGHVPEEEGRCGLHAVQDVAFISDEEVDRADSVLNELAVGADSEWFGDFNDTHTHAEVVALFQEAIRREKHKAGVPVEIPEPASAPTEVPA